jgi:L-ornithine N5-oxygenase
VVQAAAGDGGIELQVVDGLVGAPALRRYDAVVLATGYDRDIRSRFLSAIDPYLDGFSVDRDYRLRTRPEFRPQIHLQGYSEASHGLSDTLLSVLAIRSQEIANSILDAQSARIGLAVAGHRIRQLGQ